ncbi:uncharacterized protein EAE97_000903 [Botrytis byssoidea]|uniref:Uncharacterized protein n=1 Tax=Botrytis byssoidea TaxID=139641 RepID=A0A9P5ITE6_9HELO|nr:uncharacterized protein EAE97_000903 [Botrytis byssoidea]KAF7953504.1 hypothetical protein EAE97_000903 [Botrytis byssoidea]
MTTGNTHSGSPTSPTAPWVQQSGRAGTPTSVYSNTNSPTLGAPSSPTISTSSSPQVVTPPRSTSPTISPISSNTSSHSSLPSSQNQTIPPKTPNSVLSKWGIGWETPTIIISCYLLALATALLHLFLFIYISGKAADGKDRVAPQTYISTASNILANAFSFFLKTALATSFVQYLWRLLRAQSMKISTIDTLFGLKSNPFQICTGAAIRAAPVLCVLSIMMASMTVAVSFPPGAINVVTIQRTSYNSVVVPTFNASFMGNGSGLAANQYALAVLSPISESADGSVSGFTSSGLLTGKHSNLLPRLAFQTMITGQAFDQPSPCGVNCSFVIEFEGPTLDCNSSSTNITSSVTINSTTLHPEFTIYSGNWSDLTLATPALRHKLYNGTYTNAHWQSSTLSLLDTELNTVDANSINQTSTLNTSMIQDNLYCTPGRALYTVNNTYISNILTRNVTTTFISPLTNLVLHTHDNSVIVPGFTNVSGITSGYYFGSNPANWSAEALAYYRDLNMMTILDTMFYYLAGEFTALPAVLLDNDEERAVDAIDATGWGEDSPGFGNADNWSSGALNGTIISRTPLNTAFTHYTTNSSANPSFVITQNALNALLQNITLSASLSYSLWSTPTNTSMLTLHNIYSFSQPLNLLLPYFLSLLLSLPFLILGLWALVQNGVAAQDANFTQLLCTTSSLSAPPPTPGLSNRTSSMAIPSQLRTLTQAACLGNTESLSKPLKELRIRYGELKNPNGNPGMGNSIPIVDIRRAGFGLENEVEPLVKGGNYGVMV